MNVEGLFERLRLPVQSRLPSFDGATGWVNTAPLTPADVHDKVVAVDFWTFTCINWLRTLPYLRAWNETYAPLGLVIVGVHTPEFGVEHDIGRVQRAARDLGVDYAIAIDNDYAVWDAFANQYWPALYIADAGGRIRHQHFGEGGYDRSEKVIRHLLTAAGASDLPDPVKSVEVRGIEQPADRHLGSPETYLGLARGQGFASPERPELDEPRVFTVPAQLRRNEWALAGEWSIGPEQAVNTGANGRIEYRFHARDVNLILVPPADGQSARFRVRVDGDAPSDAHGIDVDERGEGVVTDARLYQLVRQPGEIEDRQFEIELLDPGAAALCFTFG